MCEQSAKVWLLTILVVGCSTSDHLPTASSRRPDAARSESTDHSNGDITSSAAEYVHDHSILMEPSHADWLQAATRLETSGNAFTLVLLDEMADSDLPNAQQVALDRIRAKVEALAAGGEESVQTLLERAAYADLMCNPLETRLKDWTLAYVGKTADEPNVRAELERLSTQYNPRNEGQTNYSSMQERVPIYARALLNEENPAQ